MDTHKLTHTGYPQVILVVGPHALPLDPLPLFSSTFDDAGGREVYGCAHMY